MRSPTKLTAFLNIPTTWVHSVQSDTDKKGMICHSWEYVLLFHEIWLPEKKWEKTDMAFCYENILSRPLPGIIISFQQKLLSACHFDPAAVKTVDWKTGCGFQYEQWKQVRKHWDLCSQSFPWPLSTVQVGFLSFPFLVLFLFIFVCFCLSLLFCSCFSTVGRKWEVKLSDLRKGVAETESIGLQGPDFILSRKPIANVHWPGWGNRHALWGQFSPVIQLGTQISP